MSQCPVSRRPSVRNRLARSSALAIAVSALCCAGAATAVPVSYELDWTSNMTAYNDYANQCLAGSCPATPLNPHGDILFSWGEDNNDTYNTVRTWSLPAHPSFTLSKITITANGPVGTGAYYTVGEGAAPAWELASSAADTQVADSQVKITIGASSAPSYSAALFMDAYPVPATWYDTSGSSNVTLPTPINFTFEPAAGTTIAVAQGAPISFRFFESSWNAAADYAPDLVFSSMHVTITGEELSPPQLTADNVAIGDVRIGTSATGTAKVSNTGDTAAAGVTLTPQPASSLFAPTDTVDLGTLAAAGGNATQTYTYKPPTPDERSPADDGQHAVTDTLTVKVASTTSGANATSFTVSGNAVGPVFDLSGAGITGTTIDLGTVQINKTVVRHFTLSNLFGDNLANNSLSDLTIINVGLGSGPVKIQDSLGNPLTGPFVLDALGDTTPGRTYQRGFDLVFTPTTLGSIATLALSFATDVNGPLYNGTNPASKTFLFNVTGAGVAPIPSVLFLFAFGLSGLALRRR